ncbi:MAG: hypothetical protein H6Q36_1347 [Chloroflexi bacterium]|nr:hypothetical protein [Chloroflexota bacterium]
MRFKRNEAIGGVEVTDVFRGAQPAGSGGRMIAETLQAAGTARPEVIRISSIMETQPTSSQLAGGTHPAETVLGRTLTNAVDALGGTITDWSSGVAQGKPWIQARVRY